MKWFLFSSVLICKSIFKRISHYKGQFFCSSRWDIQVWNATFHTGHTETTLLLQILPTSIKCTLKKNVFKKSWWKLALKQLANQECTVFLNSHLFWDSHTLWLHVMNRIVCLVCGIYLISLYHPLKAFPNPSPRNALSRVIYTSL